MEKVETLHEINKQDWWGLHGSMIDMNGCLSDAHLCSQYIQTVDAVVQLFGLFVISCFS